jgi:hypothetical protein|tara:strand:- start:289 stop:1545 length:1257 start_codon:yes stop_codon:yes gene_type:complete
MPRKCINLESQPGFQEIYAPNMQRAIDEGLSGYSGTGVVDWGYDQDKVVKPIPHVAEIKTRHKRKGFNRAKNEGEKANLIRKLFFNSEEIANPKGMLVELLIGSSNEKGIDFLSKLKIAPDLIEWHADKGRSSSFGRRNKESGLLFNTVLSMRRGRNKRTSRTARHEIGHFIDWLLGTIHKPAISKERGEDAGLKTIDGRTVVMVKDLKTGEISEYVGNWTFDQKSQTYHKGRNKEYFLTDLYPSFEQAFQRDIEMLKLDDVKGQKEFIDSVIKEYIEPVQTLIEKGIVDGDALTDIFNESAGLFDIIDAMTMGQFSARKYGGGHGKPYWYGLSWKNLKQQMSRKEFNSLLKDEDSLKKIFDKKKRESGDPRLHEAFANLFEAWSSNDAKSWKRVSKVFPNLSLEFNRIMREFSGIIG